MDPCGCPGDLYVTDNAFDSHTDEPCSSPMLGFVLSMLVLIVIKVWVNVLQFRLWFNRMKILRQRNPDVRRLPIVPSISAIITFSFLLLLILIASNVANVSNGAGTAIYGIMSFLWATVCLLLVKKVIRLGRKLIPVATAHGPTITLETSSLNGAGRAEKIENRLRVLNTFDGFLKILLTLQVASMFAFIICGIGCLIDPLNPAWRRSVFALVGCFGLTLGLSLIYHLERIIQASKYFITTLGSQPTEELQRVHRGIIIMRLSQLTWLVTEMLMGIPHLLIAADVISIRWYAVVMFLAIETIASVFAYYSTRPVPKHREIKATSFNGIVGNVKWEATPKVLDE